MTEDPIDMMCEESGLELCAEVIGNVERYRLLSCFVSGEGTGGITPNTTPTTTAPVMNKSHVGVRLCSYGW